MRLSSSSWLIASFLGLGLFACSGDDQGTATTESSSGSTSNASASSTTDNTSGSTTDTTGTETTGETSPTTSTTDPTTDPTTSTTDPTTDPTTSTSTTTDPTTDGGACGDGNVDGDEVCDDGNTKTEFPGGDGVPHAYTDANCLDGCDLVQATCGDGVVDPGEACDDGNQESHDACTTSCTKNDGDFHSPCTRDCNGQTCGADDIAAGKITGCGAITAPAGSQKVCFESGNVKIPNIIDKKLYFAEGECLIAAQKCKGLFCPGYTTFGDYDGFNACPAGTTLIDRVTDQGGVTVSTKVCHKVCESDIECRWNAHDAFWKKPGQIRCQTTPDSKGVKICSDAQNQ